MVLEKRRGNDGYGRQQAETGSIVQAQAPIDDGRASDIGTRLRPRTRAAGSREGRCTFVGKAMCIVVRTEARFGKDLER